MQAKQNSPSERFKRKVLMRWRWLAERGMSVEQGALEIGVGADDLRRWSRGEEAEAPLIVPVQVEAESTSPRQITVVLARGVRVEGMTVADIAELLRRLS